MITEFKIFESEHNYFIGEYIEVSEKYFTDKSLKYFAKIIKIDNSDCPYLVKFSSERELWITESMIIRNLTTEEIKQYELELISNKYNI